MEYLDLIPKSDCTGCASCANGCPVKCITMEPDEKGFLYPNVDRSVCLQCGNCKTACPVLNKDRFQTPVESVFYGCKNSDDSIRIASSSGGFFYELARCVIVKGGIVFGARFSDDFKKVYHSEAQTMDEVRPMMVSKYVQSEIGQSYVKVRDYLKIGKTVLFTGTPCQIAGLRSFIGDNDNLILAEIICHGVPSPKVWNIYLSSIENEYGGTVAFVTFRDKSRSWRQSDFKVEFDNGQTFIQPNKDNPYMKSFLRNLSLRDSCTDCKFKRFASGADITMGDFWGSTELGSCYSDDIGISVIALHSDRGRDAFNTLQGRLTGVVRLSEYSAFVFNESYKTSPAKHPLSDSFFERIDKEIIGALIDEMAPERQSTGKTKGSFLYLIRKVYKAVKRSNAK